jgi:hypothetical protein
MGEERREIFGEILAEIWENTTTSPPGVKLHL